MASIETATLLWTKPTVQDQRVTTKHRRRQRPRPSPSAGSDSGQGLDVACDAIRAHEGPNEPQVLGIQNPPQQALGRDDYGKAGGRSCLFDYGSLVCKLGTQQYPVMFERPSVVASKAWSASD